MGVRSVAIRACGRGKVDTGVSRMAVRACGAAAAVVALLSAAIALHWPPLHAGTGAGRLCGRVALLAGLCLARARPALGSQPEGRAWLRTRPPGSSELLGAWARSPWDASH